MDAVFETDFPNLNLIKRGKVRDIYDLGETLLLVASDRISAFDVVMPNPVPDKGRVLTQISLFWFNVMAPLVSNHLVTSDVSAYPPECADYAQILDGRSMVIRKAAPLPIECVVRGYITGSGWKDYQQSGQVCGIDLPEGLVESQRLPEPLFTPSTKAELGEHDENIDFATAAQTIGEDLAERVKDLSLQIYTRGVELAAQRGIIIADTKFEFGMADGELILIDEVLTPDSSRFWPKASYAPGQSQNSFDKQYLRDFLVNSGWNKQPPAPQLPEEIVSNTRAKYLEALELFTA